MKIHSFVLLRIVEKSSVKTRTLLYISEHILAKSLMAACSVIRSLRLLEIVLITNVGTLKKGNNNSNFYIIIGHMNAEYAIKNSIVSTR